MFMKKFMEDFDMVLKMKMIAECWSFFLEAHSLLVAVGSTRDRALAG